MMSDFHPSAPPLRPRRKTAALTPPALRAKLATNLRARPTAARSPIPNKERRQLRVQGDYTFDADVQTVWDALLSPDTLASCIPGCDSIAPTGENSYSVELNVRVGAVSGKYAGEVSVENVQPLESYTMVVSGSGRGGTVRGSGDLSFSESDGKTTVRISGDTQVTGVVARVGQRLLGGASRMMMNQFFNCLRTKIEA